MEPSTKRTGFLPVPDYVRHQIEAHCCTNEQEAFAVAYYRDRCFEGYVDRSEVAIISESSSEEEDSEGDDDDESGAEKHSQRWQRRRRFSTAIKRAEREQLVRVVTESIKIPEKRKSDNVESIDRVVRSPSPPASALSPMEDVEYLSTCKPRQWNSSTDLLFVVRGSVSPTMLLAPPPPSWSDEHYLDEKEKWRATQ